MHTLAPSFLYLTDFGPVIDVGIDSGIDTGINPTQRFLLIP